MTKHNKSHKRNTTLTKTELLNECHRLDSYAVRLEKQNAYLLEQNACLQAQIRNSQTSVVADTVERLQADNARLAEQVGKLVAELERAQAGEKTR